MKIMHIMAGQGLGGAETYSTDVMLSLHQSGLDQCVVMAAGAPRFAELEQAGLRMAPEVLAIPFSFLRRRRLQQLINKEKPDIIHCWMRRAASLLPKTQIPVIGWFGGYYEPRHFGRCQEFVGVTRDIAAHMIKHGVPAQHAHYIPTFPDIANLPPVPRADFDTPEEAKVILALSRLHPKKGLDTLLHALVHMPTDTYAWLAGDGPDGEKLRNLSAQLGLDKRVRFLGWRTDRAALLGAADVCVLPSRYEPFGTVILEAWAARVPFVACKSAGPAAHVEDGINGLLVEIDDANGLAQALQRVLNNTTLAAQLVDTGYKTYETSFTREAVTRQWLSFYDGLFERAYGTSHEMSAE